jgi:hypothetical protein
MNGRRGADSCGFAPNRAGSQPSRVSAFRRELHGRATLVRPVHVRRQLSPSESRLAQAAAHARVAAGSSVAGAAATVGAGDAVVRLGQEESDHDRRPNVRNAGRTFRWWGRRRGRPPPPGVYRLMMLWTSTISGSPGSIPSSARIGPRRAPNASSCACEFQTMLTLKSVPRPEQISQSWPSAGEMPRRRAWRPHGRTARQSATQGRTGLAHYGGPLVPVAFAPTPLRVSSVSGRRSHDGAARSGDIAEHLPRPGLSVPGTFSTGQRGEAGGVGTCRAEGMSGLGAARPCDACWSILPGMVDR